MRTEILGQPRAKLAFSSTAPVVNVVCKLCDVAPDGTSALVTGGVLNATHRSSHAQPEALIPGQAYDLEVVLDATAWAFEPGHRVRLDVSGSDWPNTWPSPFPAENSVAWGGQGRSCLILPRVPSGRPEEAPSLGEPAMPVAGYAVGGAPPEVRVVRDPVGERAWFEVNASERGELPEEGVRMAYDWRSSFAASDRDPAHAALSAEHDMRITRRGSEARAHVRARLESSVDAFHLGIDLCVKVDGVERFSRHWMRSFPRPLV
jgi:hypothetical protein